MKLQKKIFNILLLFLFVDAIIAQNLVPNPSFEDTVICPTSVNQVYNCQLWRNPTQCTPDYYNSCSTTSGGAVSVPSNGVGMQVAHTGVAYMGIWTMAKIGPGSNREYIQSNLTSSLIANHKYLVSFYVSLAEISQYAISSLGAYLSNNQITGSSACNLLPFIPQIQGKSGNVLLDKNNWVIVQDTLFANGGEQYITIGNFMQDSLSDTLYLGNTGGANSAYYYIDDVSVIDYGPMGIRDFVKSGSIAISPNPSDGYAFIKNQLRNEQRVKIEVTDATGKEVYKQQLLINDTMELNFQLPDGLYFIQIVSNTETTIHKIVIQK